MNSDEESIAAEQQALEKQSAEDDAACSTQTAPTVAILKAEVFNSISLSEWRARTLAHTVQDLCEQVRVRLAEAYSLFGAPTENEVCALE